MLARKTFPVTSHLLFVHILTGLINWMCIVIKIVRIEWNTEKKIINKGDLPTPHRPADRTMSSSFCIGFCALYVVYFFYSKPRLRDI